MQLWDLAMGVRPAWLVLTTAIFLGVALWAYAPGRRGRLDRAARIPLDDDR